MSEKIDVSVIIPVYNEEASIKKTVELVRLALLKSNVNNFEIIVVNDGSADDSAKIIRSIKDIMPYNHLKNRGYGASLKSGIRLSKYSWILIIDADGTYPADAIPKLISETRDADMVVGARTGRNVNVPLMRRPAKAMLNMFARILSGIKIPDLNSGLRIFKKDVAISFWNLFPEGFSFTTTITLASHVNNYTVKYIPINYYKRQGKSTINPIRDFYRFMMLIFKIVLYFNPLKFFIPVSILVLIFAIIRGYRDYMVANHLGDLAVILAFTAVQIFFFGLLADLVNKRLK